MVKIFEKVLSFSVTLASSSSYIGDYVLATVTFKWREDV